MVEKKYISEQEKEIIWHKMSEAVGYVSNEKAGKKGYWKTPPADLPWLCRDSIGTYAVAYSELTNPTYAQECYKLSL
jgi:hypothetical protein